MGVIIGTASVGGGKEVANPGKDPVDGSARAFGQHALGVADVERVAGDQLLDDQDELLLQGNSPDEHGSRVFAEDQPDFGQNGCSADEGIQLVE